MVVRNMRKEMMRAIVAAVFTFVACPTAWPQDSDAELRREIERLKQGQQQINRELQEIKRLLQARLQDRPAAAPSGPQVKGKVFDIGDNPVKGARTAKLTLVEFTDYQ